MPSFEFWYAYTLVRVVHVRSRRTPMVGYMFGGARPPFQPPLLQHNNECFKVQRKEGCTRAAMHIKGTPRVYVQTASVRGLDGAVHSKPDGGEIFQINAVGQMYELKKERQQFCFLLVAR